MRLSKVLLRAFLLSKLFLKSVKWEAVQLEKYLSYSLRDSLPHVFSYSDIWLEGRIYLSTIEKAS